MGLAYVPTKLGLIWGGSFVGKYASPIEHLDIWAGDLCQSSEAYNPDDPWDWCTKTYIYQTKIPKVGKYTVRPMDPMGTWFYIQISVKITTIIYLPILFDLFFLMVKT